MRKLALLFLSVSLVCFVGAGYLVWQRYYNPNRLAFAASPPSAAPVVRYQSFWPARIQIPDLQIDLPVEPAEIKNGQWQVTSRGVSYLVSSPPPGQPGNSIFYGHNWPRLLGRLKNIRVGQSIILEASSGSQLKFTVARIQIVPPSDTSVLLPTIEPQLTLYTCIGFSDSKRLVVTALPQEP